MKPILITVAALLPLTGCFNPNTPYYGSPAFSLAEREQIELAAKEWLIATNGMNQINIIWERPKGYQKTIDRRSGAQPPNGRDAWFMGMTQYKQDVFDKVERIYLWPDGKTLKDLYLDVLHEFGHSSGIEYHLKTEWTVMYPNMEKQALCLQPLDLEAYCSSNDCNASDMNPCPNLKGRE